MTFWKKLFRRQSKPASMRQRCGLDEVKQIIRQCSGARDFVKRATEAGFTIVGEDYMGLTMEGEDCKFILTVLASYGPDKIHSLVFKDGDKPSFTLINEGRHIF